ncbi:General amino-acid permease GAP1 [Hypsibius exemplaris]|uniref:General amino-acid permease GAP1 n=1 Tax=Hypsibius exemplaris TaxID=2072580 RepID=A0A1W0WAR9_HYPEX|nr:General amino-acid permease GAP1 [Hypsibius exemplaris]
MEKAEDSPPPPYTRLDEPDEVAKDPLWRRYVNSFRRMEVAAAEADPSDDPEKPMKIVDKTDMGLKRSLTNRHIQMIAFGGAIGTGLFIGSGAVLSSSGPASVLIGFALIGTMLFNVVMALGEMAVLYPIAGSFNVYCTRFIDPAWGFAIGWNYAIQWLVTLPLELTAATITINYWHNNVDPHIWITIVLLLVVFINCFGVKGYGEAEFLFSMVKIIAVIAFIIVGVVIDVGGGPKGEYLGTKTWQDPGPFNNGFKGFCAVFVTAAFAFGGAEMVGLAAAESAEPRKTLPKATKQVFWRITLFYLVTLLLIGFIVPYTDPRLLGASATANVTASPFVIAIDNAGIKILPSIFNGVILVSVLSVGNSAVYGASRTLCALAQQGQAPQILGYIDREGRPLVSIIISLLFGGIAYINGLASSDAHPSIGSSPSPASPPSSLGAPSAGLTSVFAGPGRRKATPSTNYHSKRPLGGPPSADTFFQAYLAFPITILSYVVWKVYKKTPFMVTHGGSATGTSLLDTETMDLDTGRRDLDLATILVEERAAYAALPAWIKFYRSFCG